MQKQKRRQKGEGSIFQLASDGRWVAAVTGDDGKTKRFYGSTAEKATEALARARNQQLDGVPFADARLTVGRWLDTWLKNVKPPNTAPKTWITYEGFVRLHLAPHLGDIRLKELQPQHVRDFMARAALRGEDAARYAVRVSGHAEWALSASWWTQHASEDRGWYRANQARRNETRELL